MNLISKFSITARAPLRLGIGGGGTDVSPYCDKYGSYILNATLNRYAYCVLTNNDDMRVKFVSNDLGVTESYCLEDEILATGPLDLLKAVYLTFVERYCDGRRFYISINTFCDSPMGSGLGSSSTLVVAIIKALCELLNVALDDYEIAELAFYVERIQCGHQGGRQDMYSATFGGFNFMEFGANNKAIITPLRIKNWIVYNLEASLIMFYTGISRKSAKIINDQANRIKENKKDSIDALHKIKMESHILKQSLLKGDFENYVSCWQAGWEHKKRLSPLVLNTELNSIYEAALSSGAFAGKISGAGGGGFMVFFTPIENRSNVINALKKFDGIVSNCHFTNQGVKAWKIK